MARLREKIASGQPVIGTFIKTPAYQIVEILALSDLDFLVADAEHAPIDLRDLDAMALAARCGEMPLGIRPRKSTIDYISPAMDLGCSFVLAPHVKTRADALDVVGSVRFSGRRRGFSPSTRAANYGNMAPAAYKQITEDDTVVMVQIEDGEALENIDSISAVPGVDVLFVGPADLGESLGCGPNDDSVKEAIHKVAEAAQRAGKAAGLFVPRSEGIASWLDAGVSVFVCGSDQSLLQVGVRSISLLQAGK
jgi:2-keto-3-deoxy-L-rhamnonate aldolase RhmA